MRLRISKGKKIFLIFIFLLLALGIVYTQFFYLNPLKNELKLKNQTLESEQKLLNDISENKKDMKDHQVNTRELQKKIPVKPNQDQLILDLQQAETVSGSQIKSMDFSIVGQSDTQNDQNSIENTIQQSNSTTIKTADQTAEKVLPIGLQKLTGKIKIESPGYEEFEKFIDALEKLKRIIVVESIEYDVENEQDLLVDMDSPFSYELTITAFYMPGLTDLENQMPEIDAPNPAEKQNPLTRFPEVTTP
jgi:type IV pilus assembly protein PilO